MIAEFQSFIYGNLMQNFFDNLNQTNIKKYNLPKGNIGEIKKRYSKTLKDAKAIFPKKGSKIDSKRYNSFKSLIKKSHPPFIIIFDEIEKIIDLVKLQKYLSNSIKELKKTGETSEALNDSVTITVLESYVKKKKALPNSNEMAKAFSSIAKKSLPECSKMVRKSLNKNAKKMLKSQREEHGLFKLRLYDRWEKAIDLFECLIKASEEAGIEHCDKLFSKSDESNDFKHEAVIKIHARSIQIAKEILALIKSGFADGANARWRSLHELSVTCLFLTENNNEVSKRYLDHEIVKIYKEAKDYNLVYKKLGYSPISSKEFNQIKKNYDELIEYYGKGFKYRNGFEWIPESILSNRNFRALEEHVKVDKLHPFYNLSCNSVHGGARGFYRLGLMDNFQDKILLTGPSNYGHADPIQNTTISLIHISTSLLTLEPDFDSLLKVHILNSYSHEISITATDIQKQIEKET